VFQGTGEQMKLTTLIHIKISTELQAQLKSEANKLNITLSELCRKKLSNQLNYDELDRLLISFWNKLREKNSYAQA
jgi:hypothetical protein